MHDFISFTQKHWNLSLLFLIALGLVLLIEWIRFKKRAFGLTPFQLTQMINHQNAVVIDLRPSDTFAKGHIINAISLPVEEFEEKFKKIEKMKARPIILVCAKGLESPKIASILEKKGLNPHILDGGMANWVNADLPLAKA